MPTASLLKAREEKPLLFSFYFPHCIDSGSLIHLSSSLLDRIICMCTCVWLYVCVCICVCLQIYKHEILGFPRSPSVPSTEPLQEMKASIASDLPMSTQIHEYKKETE